MIDLRSDTLTLPDKEMLDTILSAKLGDDGRVDEYGRGEDKTVNELEDLAAELTGKEAAMLVPSGTFGNSLVGFSLCNPGDSILVDEKQHMLRTEKVLFDKRYGRMNPVIYKMNKNMTPDLDMIDELLNASGAKLICIENTHNSLGGYYIPVEELGKIRKIADRYGAKIHMDGARVFHAAAALDVEVREIAQYVDSLMFCLSKGLGAPIGSLICGTSTMIKRARELRKIFGGGMRQAGVIAAPGIYALKHNVKDLNKDIINAKHVYNILYGKLKKITMQKEGQSNILMLNLSDTKVSPSKFCDMAKEKGLLIRPVSEDSVRLVFYRDIDASMSEEAAEIILELDKMI